MISPWEGYVCMGYTGKEMINIILEAFEKVGIENHPSAEEIWNELDGTIFFFFDWAMVELGKWEKSMFSPFIENSDKK